MHPVSYPTPKVSVQSVDVISAGFKKPRNMYPTFNQKINQNFASELDQAPIIYQAPVKSKVAGVK